MIEQRRFERKPLSARVEVMHPDMGAFEWQARDISEGGIYVLTANSPKPPVGTILQVRIKRHTGALNEDPMPMQVVHHQRDGLGLMFVAEDQA